MSFTSEDIKRLRDTSQAGMLDCKKALEATNGNFEEAIDYLRKKGLSVAASKVGRMAAEGAVAVYARDNVGAMVELNSETDFVARNPDFQKLAEDVAQLACETKLAYDDLLKAPYPGVTHTVAEEIVERVGVIKENIQLRRSFVCAVDKGAVVSYVHNAYKPGLGKIGVLVALASDTSDTEGVRECGKKIAMHIAASKPKALRIEDLSADDIAREKDIYAEQSRASGKPENVIEKMIEGRIRKYYEEVVLLEQVFVFDTKMKVSDFVTESAKTLSGLTIQDFAYFIVGEGVTE